jgi:hypothetical protein
MAPRGEKSGDCPDFRGAVDAARNIRRIAAKMGLSPSAPPWPVARRGFAGYLELTKNFPDSEGDYSGLGKLDHDFRSDFR